MVEETNDILYIKRLQRRARVNERNRLNPQPNRDSIKRYRQKYPEKYKEQRRLDYLKHRQEYIDRAKLSKQRRPEKYRLYNLQYGKRWRAMRKCQKILDPSKKYFIGDLCWTDFKRRITHGNARSKLFSVLNQYICQSCGYSDERILQFDHIHNGGNKERKTFRDLYTLYRFYVLNPELARRTLQVLCPNCNMIREVQRRTQSH